MFELKTKRLLIREVQESDLEILHQKIFNASEVMRFSSGLQTIDRVQEWIHSCLDSYKKYGFGAYVIVEQATNKVIGYCGLFYFPDVNRKPEIEIGYRLAHSKWEQGYATEAAIAVRDYAFNDLNLPRLIAIIDPANIASIRVAEKLGMTYESDVMFEGYTYPDYVYSINKG